MRALLTLVLGILLAAIAGIGSAAAQGEKRVALIIGNANYQNFGALPNPRNDAEDMAEALRRVGFEVIEGPDLRKRDMDRRLAEFARAAQNADAALVFYAGHGLQHQGQNYLVPVDAKLEDEIDLDYETIRVEDVIRALDRAKGARLLILDACRNLPLAERRGRSDSLAGNQGLARITGRKGMIVAYATQANEVAFDGPPGNRNSFFTGALVKEIGEAGLEVGQLFQRVAATVNQSTQGRQMPEFSRSLPGEFFLNRGETDTQVWTRIRNSSDTAELQAFVERYPKSFYAEDAKSRIALIQQLTEMREKNRRRAEEAAARKAEQERVAALKREEEARQAEQARVAALKREEEARKAEQERVAALKREEEARKAEQVRLAALKREEEQKAEQERVAALKREEEARKAEQARLAALKREEERLAWERLEQEQRRRAEAQAAREKAEQERIAQAKREQEEAARRKAEAERIALLDREQQDAARRKAEEERLAWERLEQEQRRRAEEQAARARAEQERVARETAERQRAEEERKRIELAALEQRRAEDERRAEAARREEQRRQADAAAAQERERQQRQAEAEAERERSEWARLEQEQKRRTAELEGQRRAELERLAAAPPSAAAAEPEAGKRIEMAALPEATRRIPEIAPAPGHPDANIAPPVAPKPVNTPELVRGAQQELSRIGCYDGEVDGDFGAGTRTALERYGRRLKRQRAPAEVTDDLIIELKAHKARVCPLECDDGERVQGNRCVAIPKEKVKPVAAPKRKLEPVAAKPKPEPVAARPRPEPAAARPRPQPVAAAPRPQPAAPAPAAPAQQARSPRPVLGVGF